MFSIKEITSVVLISIIIAFLMNPFAGKQIYLTLFVSFFLVAFLNVLTKKIVAYFFDAKINVKIWEIYRYGFRKEFHFTQPIPGGVVIPLLFKMFFFPINIFVWMACLVFDTEPEAYKAARRHGLYKFSEMAEEEIGWIAASGIAMNLLLALIGYLFGFPEFSRINIFYALFNMIPVSSLDGNKIFFGNLALWMFLVALIFIGFFFSIFII